MTRVKCGWSACKHNTATKRKEIGDCTKEEVLLNYRYFDFKDTEIDSLECGDFEWDIRKFDW